MKRYLLLTANVGSLFEEDCRLQGPWLRTMSERIMRDSAEFVVIHMQETGGKKFQSCSWQVPKLVEELFGLLRAQYPICRAFLDLDFENTLYTALGSIYFVRESSESRIHQYNFEKNVYEPMEKGVEILTKDLDRTPTVIKQKFPKHFWPAIKWGRKGYMHARFKIGKQSFDFVNVHLFHDESNLALIHENPLLYSSNRKRALDYVLEQLKRNENGSPSMVFIFGDLNFRLNCPSFLNKLTARTETHPINDADPHGSVAESLSIPPGGPDHLQTDPLRRTVSAIEFRRDCAEEEEAPSCVLRIEKKRFDYFNHKKLLNEWQTYLEDDREAKNFPHLNELPITFPPTYPWSEDPCESEVLMKTRAPAWCDRVLMNDFAFKKVFKGDPLYESIGRDVCMGDHKPVLLTFHMADE